MKTRLAALLIFASAFAAAQGSADFVVLESWKCYPDGVFMPSDQYTLLQKRRAVESERIYGVVRFRGTFYDSLFEIEGVDRRWDFGEDLEYSFVLTPEGSAAFYDFREVEEGEEIAPQHIFQCTES